MAVRRAVSGRTALSWAILAGVAVRVGALIHVYVSCVLRFGVVVIRMIEMMCIIAIVQVVHCNSYHFMKYSMLQANRFRAGFGCGHATAQVRRSEKRLLPVRPAS